MLCFVILLGQITLSDMWSFVPLVHFPAKKEEPPSCCPNQDFMTGFIVQVSITHGHHRESLHVIRGCCHSNITPACYCRVKFTLNASSCIPLHLYLQLYFDHSWVLKFLLDLCAQHTCSYFVLCVCVCVCVLCRDTAGQERFKTITTAYYRGAMVSTGCLQNKQTG